MTVPLIRLVFRPGLVSVPRLHSQSFRASSVAIQARGYAKSHRKGGSFASVPIPEVDDTHTDFAPPRGSKGRKSMHEDISPTAALEEEDVINEASRKMNATFEWFKRELAQMESRVSGRVVPSLLDPVRVYLKRDANTAIRLDQVATVGVRDGNVLVITLFDEENMKDVEKSIINAQIPNLTPQRADARTIRIVVPKPTMEARQTVATAAAKLAEETKVKIRTSRESGMKELKKMGHAKHSKFVEEMQKATDNHTKEVDAALAKLKKMIVN
ncbi:Ribosome-recycling factor [Ceratobasidium theobromae]|uniref:Ribosome-recycling factor n=1 Tax=Ceratobasidium theobromae TaxID=1582974 RepID=A0A5N5QBI9_9AGAM|nr:Ribosome-recycling factor [Ceratobasidium theobromae]